MAKIRVGIIGTGGIAQGHIKRLSEHPDAEVTALCDIAPDQIDKTKARHTHLPADIPTFTDYKELIASGKVDAVNIDTPHTLHHEMIMNSLDAGLHVLTEKPMVCTVAHANEVINKANGAGKILAINYQRHFQPEFLYVRDAIANGKIGGIEFVQGLQGQEWRKGVAGTWRHDPALSGGGQLNDSGSHMLAVLLFVTGLSVTEVSAFIDNLDVPVDINSALTLKFNNGAQGSVSIMGDAPMFYEDLTFVGDNGAFFMRNGKLEMADGQGKRSTPTTEEMPKGTNPDVNFIEAIMGREEVGVKPEMGLRVIELTEAAWKSAAEGSTVKVTR